VRLKWAEEDADGKHIFGMLQDLEMNMTFFMDGPQFPKYE